MPTVEMYFHDKGDWFEITTSLQVLPCVKLKQYNKAKIAMVITNQIDNYYLKNYEFKKLKMDHGNTFEPLVI